MEWRDRRVSMGISQAALARAARISRTALSLIENGHMRPSVRTSRALERALDPFSDPVRLVHGGGALAAAEALRDVARETGRAYALTLDVAAWLLTRYQTPATAWAYVRAREAWTARLRRRSVRKAASGERADLVLLRAPDDVLADARPHEGFMLVHPRRLVQDSARLGGRHALDAARVYVELREARSPGLRLDPDALLKVYEEVVAST